MGTEFHEAHKGNLKIPVYWEMVSCWLINRYKHSGGTCCLFIQWIKLFISTFQTAFKFYLLQWFWHILACKTHYFLQLVHEETVTAETIQYILILPSHILLLSSSSGSSLHIQTVWVMSPISNWHTNAKLFCDFCARNNLNNIYLIYNLQHFWNWQQLMVHAGS